ncbi:MAG: HU family DNA-binding protein [Acidobacteriota bacterium]
MVKADLARIVHEIHGGLPYDEAKDIVECMIARIKESLLRGEDVKLAGFGSLRVIERKGRLGRNPQTGDRIELAPSRYVTFRPSRIANFRR